MFNGQRPTSGSESNTNNRISSKNILENQKGAKIRFLTVSDLKPPATTAATKQQKQQKNRKEQQHEQQQTAKVATKTTRNSKKNSTQQKASIKQQQKMAKTTRKNNRSSANLLESHKLHGFFGRDRPRPTLTTISFGHFRG